MSDEQKKYWFNLETKEVEHGRQSPGADRAGPFDSAEEAARAPEILRERSQAWAEDEAAEDDWKDGE